MLPSRLRIECISGSVDGKRIKLLSFQYQDFITFNKVVLSNSHLSCVDLSIDCFCAADTSSSMTLLELFSCNVYLSLDKVFTIPDLVYQKLEKAEDEESKNSYLAQ